METQSRTVIVLGSHRDEAGKNVSEAVAAVGAHVEFTTSASDLQTLVAEHDPLAIVIRGGGSSAADTCGQLRSQPKLLHTPIFCETPTPGDLAFVELFAGGGDDLVSLASSLPLARRLRALPPVDDRKPAGPSQRHRAGYAVVAGADARWRTVMARALFNGGYAVRFVSSAADAVEESLAHGARLVVASETLRPEGAVAALRAARQRGSNVPWVVVAAPKTFRAKLSEVSTLGAVAVADAFSPPENALFIANELLAQGRIDKRSSARLLYGATVAFRVAGRDEDELGFTYNISEQGIYVRTLAPLAPGEEAWLDLWPPRSERRVRLVGDGRVAESLRPYRGGDGSLRGSASSSPAGWATISSATAPGTPRLGTARRRAPSASRQPRRADSSCKLGFVHRNESRPVPTPPRGPRS